MTEDRALARRVSGATAGLVALIAVTGFTLGGAEQALGALVGGLVTIANFLWLRWTAAATLGRGRPVSGQALRRALWIAASGARFGALALVVGLGAAQGWLGLTGLLAALPALPAMVVVEGLRVARAS
ncbi:MAG: hypothetical protein ACREMB_00460 [Candidatus Rokuibacteriota bacterium]